jgi:uncharacterized YceG family protein
VAEQPRLRSKRRPWLVALSLLLITGAGIAVAVVIALRHVDQKHAVPPPPPAPKPFRIVFPEGFTRAQMAQRVTVVARIADREHRGRVKINATAYLAASRKARVPCFGTKVQTNLEGFLFPATYDFLPATTSKQLVADQIQTFCKRWAKVGMAYARSKNLVPYDVLKIASMIEREAQVPAERPLVSAVIYNRLHARMPLGIDATLRYGLHIPPTKSILQSQLQNPTPYNTRLHQGLPPTPIANPGLASLVAAAHPAKVNYLYYVRKPDHRHDYFTSSATAFYAYECAHGYGC